MPVTKYTYSVANDTLNGTVDVGTLKSELELTSIVYAIEDITEIGDVLDIYYKEALSTGDETIVTNTVAAHDGDNIVGNGIIDVKILEESLDPNKRTGGHFKAHTLAITVPGSVGVHTQDFSYPYNISVLSVEFVGKAENDGDTFSVCFAPDTIVGAITSDVSATDTVINVQDSVIANSFVGMKVNITDLTNVDDLGYILEIDKNAGTITVSTAATQAFAAATPTYVRIAVESVKDVVIDAVTAPIQVGGSKIGGSFLAANTIIRLHYDNKDGVAKDFHAILEFLY